ncbi:hypothetical protein FOA52_001183 [Chlamydomonas sp. UWO 241]|nr:hypothetical protein FOA52_001183 [Chlamydomonas sp. UWO 241]
MPWAAPADERLPWEGLHGDMDKLLEVMAGPVEQLNVYADIAGPQGDAKLELRWITMLTMTGALRRFAANCIYSLVTYGRQPHYIVATFDDSSAAECARMRLPCADAKAFMPDHQLVDGQHLFGSQAASAMWWAKQRLAHHLLGRNLTVHGTDIDVVYYRDVRKSYSRAFEMLRADAVFAAEEAPPDEWSKPLSREAYINHMNAGVYALHPNQRTMDFFDRWLARGKREGNDQIALNREIYRSYGLCYSHTQCRLTQLQGLMAVWKHPHFWQHTSCIQGSLGEGGHCDKRRLYEYDKWTSDGILEHYWGEHIHLGYYTDAERAAGYRNKDYKQAKYDFCDEMLRFSGAAQPANVLDVGCGFGGTSRHLGKMFPRAQVQGITLSPKQVERATELAKERGLDNVSFKVMDALAMDYPDDTFDLVWACESGEHMPDKRKYIEEMVRVLKPGGTLVIACWCQREETPAAPFSASEKQQLQFLYDEWAHPYFISIQEFVRLMEGTGQLEGIASDDWSKQTLPDWHNSIWSAAKEPWYLMQRPHTWYRTFRDILGLLRMHDGFSCGLMQYGMMKGVKKAKATSPGATK